jgi:hypothetical protein
MDENHDPDRTRGVSISTGVRGGTPKESANEAILGIGASTRRFLDF